MQEVRVRSHDGPIAAQEVVKRLRELRAGAPVAPVLGAYDKKLMTDKCVSDALNILGKGPPSGRNLLLRVMDWVREADHIRVRPPLDPLWTPSGQGGGPHPGARALYGVGF
eukprot:6812636-Pyramimonas_sp.AAC.1